MFKPHSSLELMVTTTQLSSFLTKGSAPYTRPLNAHFAAKTLNHFPCVCNAQLIQAAYACVS